ncbi:MAG: phytanoyl-CoA dioxygenase family protein [Chlamydiales bacterium]|nr:phytanoyl-CoA dioxygenase family protein [Chlamydiales bacterium]
MDHLLDHFLENGWIVLDLLNPLPVIEAREGLQGQLNALLQKNVPLEEYHNIAEQDAFHTDIQVKMTQFFREQKYAREILKGQKQFFKELLGRDLLIQANPYLRMTRPFKKQDNIGYHRDTFYGGSPYEVSVLVPFVDLKAESSLKVMSKSHYFSESLFPTFKVENEDKQVTKGSAKHQLGFLYAPKLMDPAIEEQMQAVPLKMGQALLFSLATVHGSVENRGDITRWSSDMRVLNALAPVDLSARPDYYETLCLSPVTASVKKYEQANREA